MIGARPRGSSSSRRVRARANGVHGRSATARNVIATMAHREPEEDRFGSRRRTKAGIPAYESIWTSDEGRREQSAGDDDDVARPLARVGVPRDAEHEHGHDDRDRLECDVERRIVRGSLERMAEGPAPRDEEHGRQRRDQGEYASKAGRVSRHGRRDPGDDGSPSRPTSARWRLTATTKIARSPMPRAGRRPRLTARLGIVRARARSRNESGRRETVSGCSLIRGTARCEPRPSCGR
jgi:hypothetical protein